MARRFSSEEKIALVRRYLLGERIALLSREANVSRTMLYRWIYVYKDNKTYKFRLLFRSRLRKGRKHYNRVPLFKDKEILHLKSKNPQLSTRQLAAIVGVSHNYVWTFLKIAHPQTHHRRISPEDKLMMLRRFEAGDRISKICEDFSVSRTIFYRWLEVYNRASHSERTVALFQRKQSVHYRYVPEVRKLAADIIVSSPRMSLRRMREEMIKVVGVKAVSRQAIYQILKDLRLDSKEKRINFSKISMPISN
jgi:transposase-like protein